MKDNKLVELRIQKKLMEDQEEKQNYVSLPFQRS